jgi:hypothetical protein
MKTMKTTKAEIMNENSVVKGTMVQPTSEIANLIDEGKFDFMYEIEMNRKLSTRHVHNLTDNIRGLYKIIGDRAVAPIYVVKRTDEKSGEGMTYILDGQHRVKACLSILKEDGIDIDINQVVLDGDALSNKQLVDIISVFNSSSVKWNNITYVELFAKMKTRGYPQFLKLMTNKSRKYYATNLAHLYTGSAQGLEKIKKGEKLDINAGNKRKAEFDEIVDILPQEANRAKLLRAVTTLIMLPEYNHDTFIPRLKNYVKRKTLSERFPLEEMELFNDFKELLIS